jgi:hypothetical protein
MNLKHAARVKMALARELGDVVKLGGRAFTVFPSPGRLSTLESFPGLSAEKVERLRGIARAALDGKLDAHRLRSMREDDALAELQTLRGVGPWAASHIYYRGAAPDDALPTVEPRVLHGLASAADIELPSPETFRHMAESWRPFRMWVCVLLSRHLARVGGWKTPGLAAERAAAGRALARRDVAPECRAPSEDVSGVSYVCASLWACETPVAGTVRSAILSGQMQLLRLSRTACLVLGYERLSCWKQRRAATLEGRP